MDHQPNQGYNANQPLRQPNPQAGNYENVTFIRGGRGRGYGRGNFSPRYEFARNNQPNYELRPTALVPENRQIRMENRSNFQASSPNSYASQGSNLAPRGGPSRGGSYGGNFYRNQQTLATNSGVRYNSVDLLASQFESGLHLSPVNAVLNRNRNATIPPNGSTVPTTTQQPSTSFQVSPGSMAPIRMPVPSHANPVIVPNCIRCGSRLIVPQTDFYQARQAIYGYPFVRAPLGFTGVGFPGVPINSPIPFCGQPISTQDYVCRQCNKPETGEKSTMTEPVDPDQNNKTE